MNLKIACTRMVRAGIKLAEAGDIESAQVLIKAADAFALGHSPQEVLNTFFPPENHEKVASIIDEIIATPSEIAMEKKAQLEQELEKRAAERKQKVAQQQAQNERKQKVAQTQEPIGAFTAAIKKK